MSLFAVSGDVHGQFEDLKLALLDLPARYGISEKELSALLLVGDVEAIRSEEEMLMVHGPAKYRKMGDFGKVLSGELTFDTPAYFIGGNHEPWSALDKDGGMITHGGNWAPGFHFLGRAGQLDIAGLKVSFISAISSPEMRQNPGQKTADRRRDNKKNQTYWTNAEIEKVRNSKARPDVLLTHEWPTGLGKGKDGQEAGSWQLTEIIERTKPKLSFHGHMHHQANTRIGETLVNGLDHIRGGQKAIKLFEKTDNGELRLID